jgi:hypothetical protein
LKVVTDVVVGHVPRCVGDETQGFGLKALEYLDVGLNYKILKGRHHSRDIGINGRIILN